MILVRLTVRVRQWLTPVQKRALATAALVACAAAVNVADINGISFIDTSTKGRLQIVGVEYVA
jgi:hypothetical protein